MASTNVDRVGRKLGKASSMGSKREKVLKKLRKTYIKMLRRYALRHMEKAHKLEDKAMLLEFELKEKGE